MPHQQGMLPDLLAPDLVAVFVGRSVSTTSADQKHYYAHPSTRFWELLDATGLTNRAGLCSSRDREITDYGVATVTGSERFRTALPRAIGGRKVSWAAGSGQGPIRFAQR